MGARPLSLFPPLPFSLLSRRWGNTCSNDIVHNDHLLALLNRARLHLEVILAIFLVEALRLTGAGQLALLPHRNETGTKPQRQAGPKQESSGLETNDDVGLLVLAVGLDDVQLETPDERFVKSDIREHGHDVLEQDARLGEVRKLAQGIAQSYLKTGEFGGAGGMGGGLSGDLGGGGGIWIVGRRIGRGRLGHAGERKGRREKRGGEGAGSNRSRTAIGSEDKNALVTSRAASRQRQPRLEVAL